MYSQFGFGSIPPAIKNLLLANIAVFLVQTLIAVNLNDALIWMLPEIYHGSIQSGGTTAFNLIFGLVPYLVLTKLFVWQVFTYMFLHGGFWHIALNMFILWMFGSKLEFTWGTREFIRYYLLTGVIAGFSILLWNFGSYTPTIGASGAIFGVLVAYALFFPDDLVYIYFLFPVRVKYFVLFLGALEFFSLPTNDHISHIGHLGGMIAGFFYLRHRYRHWGIGRNFFKNFFKKKNRWE
jgi:membrane associated rhomboid family serine protease